jgi:hypothetical protein
MWLTETLSTILDSSKTQYKIRLYGIDTPEKKQAYGQAAKRFTASLTACKIAEVKAYDTDRYSRTVGVVTVNGKNINQSLLEAGYAWQYRKYCKVSFCKDWIKLEQEARDSKQGLWADPHAIAPWDWRKGVKSSNIPSQTAKAYTASASQGVYHGNVKSHVFHTPGCRHYDCKNCVNSFESKQSAVSAGYRHCGMCKPLIWFYKLVTLTGCSHRRLSL